MELRDKPLLLLDGACGTSIQNMNITPDLWDRYEGCNEYLNLSCPDKITAMHLEFLESGADIIETNTFGATRIVLGEYGLEDRVIEINKTGVEAAREAVRQFGSGWVAGSCGPGTKLPSLGHIDPADLDKAYREQIEALMEAGVDLIILETVQDILQLKTALISTFEVMEKLEKQVPVMVSITIEKTGTMLAGTDIAAAAAIMEPFPLFSFGLNCATGPEDMQSSVHWLSHNWSGRVSCLPNQGIPEIVDGRTCYPMTPARYASEMKLFVEKWGVSLVGGCCGSTPAHIAALKKELEGVIPAAREVNR